MIKLERQIVTPPILGFGESIFQTQKKLVKKIPSVANGGPTGLEGMAQVGEEGPGGHF